jgi:hypothetical protein
VLEDSGGAADLIVDLARKICSLVCELRIR